MSTSSVGATPVQLPAFPTPEDPKQSKWQCCLGCCKGALNDVVDTLNENGIPKTPEAWIAFVEDLIPDILSRAVSYLPTTPGSSPITLIPTTPGSSTKTLDRPLTAVEGELVRKETQLVANTYGRVIGVVKQTVDATVQKSLPPASGASSTPSPLQEKVTVTKKDGSTAMLDINKVNDAIATEGQAQGWSTENIAAIQSEVPQALANLPKINGAIPVGSIHEAWLRIAQSHGCFVKEPLPIKPSPLPLSGLGEKYSKQSVAKLSGNEYHAILSSYGIQDPTNGALAPATPAAASITTTTTTTTTPTPVYSGSPGSTAV